MEHTARCRGAWARKEKHSDDEHRDDKHTDDNHNKARVELASGPRDSGILSRRAGPALEHRPSNHGRDGSRGPGDLRLERGCLSGPLITPTRFCPRPAHRRLPLGAGRLHGLPPRWVPGWRARPDPQHRRGRHRRCHLLGAARDPGSEARRQDGIAARAGCGPGGSR